MRPLRHQVFGRGHRSPATMLALNERDVFCREAAEPSSAECRVVQTRGGSDAARQAARYREGAWRRDRAEALCPPRLAGRIDALMWCLLKCSDRVVSERTIRRALVPLFMAHRLGCDPRSTIII